MKLIIVESPTKASTLNRFLGEGYDVDSTKGHIKDLPKSKLGVDIEKNFKTDYIEVESKKQIIKNLQSKAKKANEIFIATDPDREGEAIAQHTYDILNSNAKKVNAKCKRITFHEITKTAVENAIAKPGKIDKNLVSAQIARRVLDRLVGYTLSPVLWKKVRRGLSAGRVQSVTVRLIVEKEDEIQKFKSEEYWEIYARLKKDPSEVFVVQLIKKEVKDKKITDEIIQNLGKSKYSVQNVLKREVIKNPYPPFTTSTLTQSCANLFGWPAKKTMRIAQNLYEEGLITYHRTDSLNLSKSAIDSVRDYIRLQYGDKYLPVKPVFYKTKSKSAQEAHEAIRPTGVEPMPRKQMLNEQKKLYDLIWKKFMACQMNPAVYDETTINVNAKKANAKNSNEYLLRASGQIMKFDGWRKLFPIDNKSPILPDVKKDEKLDLVKVWGDQKFTQPPARYNEASLIKTLEKLGIGRPSTYAPIISTIQARAYVEKKEGKFFPTSVGLATTDFLKKNFKNEMDYGFTAEMEDNLDKIAEGKLVWQKMMKVFWSPFYKKSESVTKKAKRVKIATEKLGRKCPECKGLPAGRQGELVIRVGRFGKFISCSNFPECKYTEKYLEKIGMKCPECKVGEVIIKKSKKGSFYGCSRYPDCKWASWKKPVNNNSVNQ